MKNLEKLLEGRKFKKLIYRGSDHEFKAKKFWSKCSNQGNTLCLIKSERGNVFGGYTDLNWIANKDYKYGELIQGNGNSFLFRIRQD